METDRLIFEHIHYHLSFMKNAFVVAFIVAIFAGGCSRPMPGSSEKGMNSEQANDLRVLREYVRIENSFTKPSSTEETKKMFGQFCSKISNISLSGCSSDFRNDFINLIDAALQLKYAAEELPDSAADALMLGFVNGLNGEVDGGISRIQANVNQALQELERAAIVIKRYSD